MLELAQEADRCGVMASFSVSRQNEIFPAFYALGSALFAVDTFESLSGAWTQAWRIPRLCRTLLARLQQDQTQVVIDLMPHVWSPFVSAAIKRVGVRYLPILHDLARHQGDPTAYIRRFLDWTASREDHVITLSGSVARRLGEKQSIPPKRLSVLFHPDLNLGNQRPTHQIWKPGTPLRLLFLGRIMNYKGLTLFLDMVDRLRTKGLQVVPGVYGEGSLDNHVDRLVAMEAEVVNRWLNEDEIKHALSHYSVLVASHTEASQSGVVALALGAGMPCVVTPVGGLTEQVEDGVTGVVAHNVSATALADAVNHLANTPYLYHSICSNILRLREARSMGRFVNECVRVAIGTKGENGKVAKAFTANHEVK